MFNPFKSKPESTPQPQVAVKEHKYPAIVEEIHNEFNTAGEKILQEALSILEDCKSQDKEKGKLLSKLGFVNTPQAKMVSEVEAKEVQAKENAELVRYYSMKYPFNKFITENIVKKICEKYNLVCGDVSLYRGFVPADKLKQIESFKLREEDKIKFLCSVSSSHDPEVFGTISDKDLTNSGKYYMQPGKWDSFYITSENGTHNHIDAFITEECHNKYRGKKFVRATAIKQSLQICAPLKDMDTTGMDLKGYRLQKHIPDPVVLQPVRGGYLILAAWGDESSDELVVNNINN